MTLPYFAKQYSSMRQDGIGSAEKMVVQNTEDEEHPNSIVGYTHALVIGSTDLESSVLLS